MASPILMGAGFAAAPLLSAVQSAASSVFNPDLKSVNYTAWDRRPRLIPDLESLWDAYRRGFISASAMTTYGAWQGVPWLENPAQFQPAALNASFAGVENASARVNLWDRVFQSKLARPSISQGADLFMRRQITEDSYKEILTYNGADVQAFLNLKDTLYSPLDLGILAEAYTRGTITRQQFLDGLARLGITRPMAIRVVDELREVLPTVSDLVLFGIRDVWDADRVAQGRLFDEVPAEYIEWANKIGLGGRSGVVPPGRMQGDSARWSELHWASHWQNVPANMLFEMYRRLRPDRIARYVAQGFQIQPFTLEMLRAGLKIDDYAPGDRDYVAAIAYTPLRLFDVKRAVSARIRAAVDPQYAAQIGADNAQLMTQYDSQWARDQFLDRGMHPDDAQTAVNLAELAGLETATRELQGYIRSRRNKRLKTIEDSYRVHLLTRPEAREQYRQLGITATVADMVIDDIDAQRDVKLRNDIINSTRRDYFAGVLDEPGALAVLKANGLPEPYPQALLDSWKPQRNRTRKAISAGKIVDWLSHGLITQAEALQRLNNLGYANADEMVMLKEAQRNVDTMGARILAAQEQKKHAANREVERIAKDAERHQRQAVKDMRALLPKASLLAALRKGTVGKQYVLDRLRAQRWPEEQIQLEMGIALAGEYADAKPKAPSSNGQEITPAENNPAGAMAPAHTRADGSASAGDGHARELHDQNRGL